MMGIGLAALMDNLYQSFGFCFVVCYSDANSESLIGF
jgi:hypothetical protein